jgi:hypothetical protein
VHDQSAGPILLSTAGGFRLREQAKEGKRDSCRSGWSWTRSVHDQSAGPILLSTAGGFRLREQAKEAKRDS